MTAPAVRRDPPCVCTHPRAYHAGPTRSGLCLGARCHCTRYVPSEEAA